MMMKMVTAAATALVSVLLLVCRVDAASSSELKRIKHPLKARNYDENGMASFSFLVVGDWGRKGLYNQTMVAAQMGKVGEKLDAEFIISTGDNFYDNGLSGEDDPAFIESFSSIYTAPALQKKWFNVLGNHDYRGDVEAQLSRALRRKDRRWLCMRSYIVEAGSVDFFMVDTTPFVDKYFTDPEDHTYDWSGVMPRDNYLSNLLKDLNSALRQSKATWKIVVGHHTIKSAGHHGNTDELLVYLLPLLQDNKVDFYINGHDHCLERIVSSDQDNSVIEFITSGGGSKAWRGDEQSWDPKELKFFYDGQGFLSAHLNATSIHFEFYDVYGTSLYQWDSFKQLRYDV